MRNWLVPLALFSANPVQSFSLKETFKNFYTLEPYTSETCSGDCEGFHFNFNKYDFKIDLKAGTELSKSFLTLGINSHAQGEIVIPKMEILGLEEELKITLGGKASASLAGGTPSAKYEIWNDFFGHNFNHSLEIQPLSVNSKNYLQVGPG